MIFQKEKLLVRRLQEKDSEILSRWLSNPLVLEFYEGRDNPFDIEKVMQKFFNRTNHVAGCIVEYEGKEIGYIQYYLLDEQAKEKYGYADEVVYGIDQFIGETAYWNKGIGSILVRSMAEYLATVKKAKKVVMDPQTWNVRAIRCYEKCSFKKVKLLPKNEYHEGEYRDCWLMEYTSQKEL